jgi:nucleotide-binding universal stress UspA family protein
VAAELSRRYEAPMTIVHVFEPAPYALPETYVLYTAPQLARMYAELERLLAGAKQHTEAARASNVTTRLLEGFAAGEITRFASQGGFDLIVMGTHGRTGFKHFLVGSVAERVVQTAHCPVLTVPLRADERDHTPTDRHPQ